MAKPKPKPKAKRTKRPDLRVGLPMVAKWEPKALAKERSELAAIADKPLGARLRFYAKRLGPGFMQSAMTLGSGSAGSSLFAGALLGYTLLWAQPFAMIVGIIMLSAIAHITLSTGVRPFDALRKHVHPAIAWGFAIGSLVATIVWHFPQYAMCGAVGVDLVDLVTGAKIAPWVIGIVALVFCTWITWSYGSGARGVRIYEQVLKWLVWTVVFAFAAVVIKLSAVGQVDWGAVARGFFTFQLPEDISGRGGTVLFGALGAAVGINMVFLYPYTLLARGWGKEHRECSRFDLAVGMFLPYALATSLMIIATAATIYGTDAVPEQGTSLQPVDAAKVLAPVAGVAIGRLVFGLGILGMTLSTITLHMLVSGFIICEMLGWEPVGVRYRVATLAPAVGFLGTVLWTKLLWIAVPTSAACGALLPLAYIGFIVLMNKKEFMKEHRPTGTAAVLWNLGMGLALAVSLVYFGHYVVTAAWPKLQGWLGA
ncbi:MAG: divalent metal cation transporter [candidate division WS1 bacterium]|jgi:Mn2+/Fe2+ NRAMP family transporter|nr:divalent metal cation transporter [candidate division WS1 bacterium]